MVTAHVPVPVHAPDQPAKVEFALGAAVSVTDVPAAKVVPDGLSVTVPLPVPVVETLNVYVGAPAWVTVRICPAMVRPAVREAVPVFAAAEYVTVPLPVPLAPELIVIHEKVFDVVQLHPVPADTFVFAVPPPAPIDWLAGEIA
jgi:hypothetical protein